MQNHIRKLQQKRKNVIIFEQDILKWETELDYIRIVNNVGRRKLRKFTRNKKMVTAVRDLFHRRRNSTVFVEILGVVET